MNKRKRKKNSIARMNNQYWWATSFFYKLDNCYEKYYKEKGINYNTWYKSNSYKRCWTYIRKTHNIPKWIGYKNKAIRY